MASFLTGRRRDAIFPYTLRVATTFTIHFFFLPPPPEVAEGATGVTPSHPGDECGGSLCNRMLDMILLVYRVGAGMHFSCSWGCGVPRLASAYYPSASSCAVLPTRSSFFRVYIRTALRACGFYTSFYFIYWTLVPCKRRVATLSCFRHPTVLTLQCI